MTSYANDVNEPTSSAVTAAAAAAAMRTTATTTAGATRQQQSSQIGDATTNANNAANDDALAMVKQSQTQQQQQHLHQQPTTLQLLQHQQQHQSHRHHRYGNEDDELDDEYEDREEKADTTPENLKKIDDIIELELERERTKQQHQHQQKHTIATTTTTTASSEALALGLAVAIDESNAKFCFVRKPTTSTPTSTTTSPTPPSPSTTAATISNQTINSLHCNQKADNAYNKTAELVHTTPSSTSSSPSKLLQSPEIGNYSTNDDISINSNKGQDSDNISKVEIDASAASGDSIGSDSGKRACAFTFTFDNDDSNAAATAARYKSVMERFQNRHRRGASMSKLDNGKGAVGDSAIMTSSLTGDGISLSSSASASPLTIRGNVAGSNTNKPDAEAAQTKVKLRPRDRSTSRVRDAAKRHSWSPRSSTNELSLAPPLQTQQQHPTKSTEVATRPPISTAARRSNVMSTLTTKPKQPPPPPLVMPKASAQLIAGNRTQQFTPRSTAMQMALQKIDMLLPQSPLGDYVRNKQAGGVGGEPIDDEDDDVSEAGTYTLDGDNYTEEQKDLMNIDKSLKRKQHRHERHANHHGHHQRPKELKERMAMSPLSPTSPHSMKTPPTQFDNVSSTKIPIRTSNVLEVNYFHNEEDEDESIQHTDTDDYYGTQRGGDAKSAAAELILGNNSQHGSAFLGNMRLKALRNLLSGAQKPPSPSMHQQQQEEAADVGCFTSVTTSGVLAKQSTLDPRPLKLNRKHSLTTSQIDSSEYISNEVKLKNAPALPAMSGGYTDHQKAEYRLNLFTNQKDRQKYAATRHLIETPPETPEATTEDKLPSDTTALALAQNKNDWIQQWARNARARSEAASVSKHQHHKIKNNVMTRSYNCGGTSATAAGDTGSLTDDSLYLNHQQQLYRDHEFDYSSDPTSFMCSSTTNSASIIKPPKSPSKIPSPLHSIGRARSASRTRGSLQGLLGAQDDEIGEENYLAKTAAAINNLQQSISRKNSLKSPTDSMTSPRRRRNHAADSSADDSPLHSIESDGYRHPPPHARHRRNLSNEGYAAATLAATQATQPQLMTSSFNEQQLQLLTSGEYLMKQMRMRKNSFDGNICSPRRRVERTPEQQQQQQHQSKQQTATLSPLHRADSFSLKGSASQQSQPHQRAARPQYQNIYTPPAARQGYVPLSVAQQQQAAALLTIKKSASSNNFVQNYDDDYDENMAYYINDADDDDELVDHDDDDEALGACDIYEDYNDEYMGGCGSDEYGPRTITLHAADDTQAAPLTNTRYNKALLMRIERSKQRVAATVAGNKPNTAPQANSKANTSVPGLMACPNTPELPRRNVKSAPRAGAGAAPRQSMPRDVSLNRLASQVPNSLASAKRQLLQTAAAGVPSTAPALRGQRVQPKYLDISKYKPAQGNAFLRKNESKSTLKTPTFNDSGIKRSPSSSGLSRTDSTRASNRSVRSMMTTSCTGAIGGGSSGITNNASRASSAVRRDDSMSKQKEIEMAMWKRRSTYDPLKAAAEDRRRKEEAKRLAMVKNASDVLCESTTPETQQ